MANLVSPGYNQNTLIGSILAPSEERIIEFKGLNRRDYVEEGEMSDMVNMTSDNYPLLTPRKLRGTYELPEHVTVPLKIMARYNKIAMIAKDDSNPAEIHFYFDGQKIDDVPATDLTETTEMVAINTKICFFPAKTCISVLQSGGTAQIVSDSYSSLEESVTVLNEDVTLSNEDVRITLSGDYDFSYDDAVTIQGTLAYTPQ